MKQKRIQINWQQLLIATGFFMFSGFTGAANFDALNQSESNFQNIEQTGPDNGGSNSSSILNSLQQSQAESKKDRYLEVLNLIKQSKIQEAQNKVAGLIKQFPDEAQFYNLQALLEILNKNIDGAKKAYNKALEIDRNNAAAHLGLAKMALDANDFATAKERANSVLAFNEKFTSAYLVLADVAFKQKNNDEVERVLRTGLDKVKGNIIQSAELLGVLGRFYMSQKQPEKFVTAAEELVNQSKEDTKALALLAGAQILNKQSDAAEATLAKIIKKDPSDINHRLLLVKLLSNKPDKEKEILSLLDETAKIDGNNHQADIFKVAYLIKLNRNQEALTIAENLEKKYPKLAIGKLLKGDVALAEKQFDKALALYQQAHAIEANNTVLFAIADILKSQGKSDEAIALLEKESAKDNKNNGIHFKLATLHQLQNKLDKAQLHYEAMLNQQADNPLALNNLAWLYLQQNNPKALEFAKKAHELAPDASAITDTYGYILLKQGKASDGLPLIEKAVAETPKDNTMQYHLAEAYAANNNKAKAIEILEKLVAPDVSFTEKADAEALLKKLKAE